MQDLEPGMPILWLWTPRGGYGYSVPVVAMVVMVRGKRVGIAAKLQSGEWKPRWVSPGNIVVKLLAVEQSVEIEIGVL